MNNNIENINIWETNYNCTYFKTFEELIAFLEANNKELVFTLHDKQYPNQPHKCLLDIVADNNNVSISYTDESHPIVILNKFGGKILINPPFFEQNKEKFKEYARKKLNKKFEEAKKNNLLFIYINDYLIDDELIEYLIKSEDLKEINFQFINIINQGITEEQKKKLKDARLEVSYKGEKISTKYIFDTYTISRLAKVKVITIDINKINEENINDFNLINENTLIQISKPSEIKDERKYFEKLLKILKILETHNRSYNIKIDVENRELLKQSDLLNHTKNINLIIKNDFNDYSKEEYLKEEDKLEELILPIKKANLSPYEKYLAVYNIVKQFKPYKENNEDKDQSRKIRYILNNEYMVCVGYAKLLKILLDKVGIPCMEISVGVDTSYDKGFTKEEKTTEITQHARNIVKIDDDKHNIHGIFIADATWDNDMNNDLYNNSSLTFDRKKEAFRLETLTKDDLLLDFHNIEEFSKKLNFHLNRLIKKSYRTKENDKIAGAYKDTYHEIMNILYELDYNKYNELHQKYNENFNKVITELKELEPIFCNFLTEYAQYIIPITNQKIDQQTILEAAINIKREIDKLSEQELEEERNTLEEINSKEETKSFPYSYDPNETKDNYLTDTNEAKKR